MFNHIMVGTNDIERARRFYNAVLGTLGVGEPMSHRAPTGHIWTHSPHCTQVDSPMGASSSQMTLVWPPR